MERIDRIVNAENISRYIDRLYCDLSPERQVSLQRALDEEDRYGFRSWHLDLVEQRVTAAADRINKQLALIRRLETEGPDTESACRLLDLLQSTHENFMRVRDHLSRLGCFNLRSGSYN